MRNVMAIAWRDIRAVFVSPIAYVVLTGFTLLSGWFFFNMLGQFIRLSSQYAMLQGMDTTWLNLNDAVIAPLFHNLLFVLMIVIPMITMRSFSEEKNQSTFELLFTSPVRVSEMVLGKFLAGAALVTLMLLLSYLFPALLFVYGNPEPGMMMAGALALYLTALSFIAIGIFTSALTSNQIIATISALVILLLLFVINWPAEGAGERVAAVLTYLSVSTHFQKMAKGVIETTDLVYFASVTITFLFLTHRAVESSRWK